MRAFPPEKSAMVCAFNLRNCLVPLCDQTLDEFWRRQLESEYLGTFRFVVPDVVLNRYHAHLAAVLATYLG